MQKVLKSIFHLWHSVPSLDIGKEPFAICLVGRSLSHGKEIYVQTDVRASKSSIAVTAALLTLQDYPVNSSDTCI